MVEPDNKNMIVFQLRFQRVLEYIIGGLHC
jgi:hypothetical protein